ncbi:MAG: hypothetical protein GY820_12535 [Gammaproteobacteria bacterium]|nr:hypothetical protein [Gammaproteobacteria bacterium]
MRVSKRKERKKQKRNRALEHAFDFNSPSTSTLSSSSAEQIETPNISPPISSSPGLGDGES